MLAHAQALPLVRHDGKQAELMSHRDDYAVPSFWLLSEPELGSLQNRWCTCRFAILTYLPPTEMFSHAQPLELIGGEGGIRTPGRLPVNGFQDYGSLYPTLPVDTNESLYRGLLGV